MSAKEFLTDMEKIALSIDDIKRMNPKTNVIQYDALSKVKSIRQVMKQGTVVILLDIQAPNAPNVGHWICVLDHGDHMEHFDSYGLSMDQELAITHEKPFLSDLLKQESKVVQSTHRLQVKREGINTCGRWCVLRTRLKKLDLDNFIKLATQCHIPDITATLSTMFL